MSRKLILLLFVGLILGVPDMSEAFPQFMKVFVAEYVQGHEDQEYKNLVTKEAKCLVCHQGKSKKNRNAYGLALDELLSKKDKKDVEKIVESLKMVGEIRTDPEDQSSASFADRIAEGELPAGELEELKQEPESE